MTTPGRTPAELDLEVKLAIYRHFATTGRRPAVAEVAAAAVSDTPAVLETFARLRSQRVLFLEPDGASIHMAPPFSGVPTQHEVEAEGVRYFANCAWDALGIPAALGIPSRVRSRCEQSHEPLVMEVGADGPGSSDWLFHCLVPAARWWEDIVFT